MIIFTGQGPEAFCSGGDQRSRGDDGFVGSDSVGAQGIGRLNVLDLQIQIRRLPKPVVAMVVGYAIGGGHILHLVCDLTIAVATTRASVKPVPRVGKASMPASARDCCRATIAVPSVPRRSGSCAVNNGTRASLGDGPRQHRRAARRTRTYKTVRWCKEMLALSPLALRMMKAGFNAAEDGLAGVQQLAGDATLLYYMTEEAQEGRNAYVEKRAPDFGKFPRRP